LREGVIDGEELLDAAEPYAKIIEYAVIFVTVIAAFRLHLARFSSPLNPGTSIDERYPRCGFYLSSALIFRITSRGISINV
jgi:hypothetical protein